MTKDELTDKVWHGRIVSDATLASRLRAALYEWGRRLLPLSDHMRKDIGISSADAWREARRPFWRE